MNRLHPQDLRAIMAAIIHGPIQEGTSVVVEATDHLIGHLDATARRLPSPGLEPPRPMGDFSTVPFEIYQRDMAAASDRILAVEAEVDRLKGSMALIISMAGHPDPAEACRLVITEAKRSLGLDPA